MPEEPKPLRGPGPAIAKVVAGVAIVAALAFGATKVTQGSTSAASTQNPQGAPARNGGPPQMGAAVTGTTLVKLKTAVAAKYPGTVERAMKMQDGSYMVMVTQSSDQRVMVQVGADFNVTGVRQGGPPGGGTPPSGTTDQS